MMHAVVRLKFLQNLDFNSKFCIYGDDVWNTRLAVCKVGCDVHLPISTDTHIEHCIEYPADQVLSVNSDTMIEISVVFGLAVLIDLMPEAAIRLPNNIPAIEGDAHRQEAILLTFDRIACSDGFVE